MRRTMVTNRDIQKPNNMPEMMNLCPFFMLTWRMVMWSAAPMMKRSIKTVHMGTSRPIVGRPPRAAVVAG